MQELVDKINSMKKTEIKQKVENRIKEFKNINKQSQEELFKELCYCILTASSPAEKCIKIQNELSNCYSNMSEKEITQKLKQFGYRFPNQRSKYIIKAVDKNEQLSEIINSFEGRDLRNWIANNISGIGYKEASHFLRNIGFDNYSIIDTHILDIMQKYDLIEKSKTPVTRKQYNEKEDILKQLAKKTNLTLAELDLYLWYLETGRILK